MYLLDTNVISEWRKVRNGTGNAGVGAWIESKSLDLFYLSVITMMELRLGVVSHMRKDARQAEVYHEWVESLLLKGFGSHILPVDLAIAIRCGELQVPDRRPFRDALIGATALVHGLTVVTRDEKDFSAMGVSLLNPWS